MRVALLGAFGINNAGDNLEAIATKIALEKLVNDIEVHIFSPSFDYLPRSDENMGRGYSWTLVNLQKKEFWRRISDFDALIIGGGGLLVPVPEFEPFLLSGKNINLNSLPRTAWNALCSQWTPLNEPSLANWYEKVKTAVEYLDYVSVRSITTKKLLQRIGCPTEKINLVPDPVISLKIKNVKDIQDNLCNRFKINPDMILVGVSVGPELMKHPLNEFMEELSKALNIIQDRGIQVIIFPFGHIYQDDIACKALWMCCQHTLLIEDQLNAIEIWGLISMLDAYITIRYHGVIAALANGIPALALDCYLSNDTTSSKIRDLVCQTGLEEYYFSPMIAICGEAMSRSFLEDPFDRNLSNKIIGHLENLLTPTASKFWGGKQKKQDHDVMEHFKKMATVLELI